MRRLWIGVLLAVVLLNVPSLTGPAPSVGVASPRYGTSSPSAQALPTGAGPLGVPRPLERPPLSASTVTIRPDGSVSNLSAPIRVRGSNYTLTGPLAGSLLLERDGARFDGAGYPVLPAPGAAGIAVVGAAGTVLTNLSIAGSGVGLYAANCTQLTVLRGSFALPGWSVAIENSSSVTLTGLVGNATSGAWLDAVTGATLSSDRWPRATIASVSVRASSGVLVQGVIGNNSTVGANITGSSPVVLEGDAFQGAGTGIDLEGDSGVTLVGNNLSGARTAVRAVGSEGIAGAGDVARGARWGLDLERTSNSSFRSEELGGALVDGAVLRSDERLNLSGCDLAGAGEVGVALVASSSVLLAEDNYSGSRGTGVYANASRAVTVLGGSARGADPNASIGIDLAGDHAVTVEGITAPGNEYGLRDAGSSGLTVVGADLSRSGPRGAGISLTSDEDVVVQGADLSRANGTGLRAAGTVGLEVDGTSAGGAGSVGLNITSAVGATLIGDRLGAITGIGAWLDGVEDPVVTFATGSGATATEGAGLVAINCTGGLLENNTFDRMGLGLHLEGNVGLLAVQNNASFDATGAFLRTNLNLTLAANGFWNDTVSFDAAGDRATFVFHNNFVHDGGWRLSGATNASATSWDAGYPQGGNYWSNRSGPDQMTGPAQDIPAPLGDGIVDAPVNLSSGARDRYPLAAPWPGYSIVFTETGLASLTEWNLTIDGATYSTRSPVFAYPEIDGPGLVNFTYAIPRVPGYMAPTPSNGSGTEGRADQRVAIAFPIYTYRLTFLEVGLPAGTSWGLIFLKTQRYSAGSQVEFNVSNGTYTYLPLSITGYAVYSPPGSVTVLGAAATVLVAYVPISVGAPTQAGSSSPLEVVTIVLGVALAGVVAVLLFRPPRPRAPVRPYPGETPPPGGATGETDGTTGAPRR